MKRKILLLAGAILSLCLMCSCGSAVENSGENPSGSGSGQIAIEINKTRLELDRYESVKLEASVTGTDEVLVWSSKDENIACVDESGNVLAVGEGETEIYAKIGDETKTCKVTVNDSGARPNVFLDWSETTLKVGSEKTLLPVISYKEMQYTNYTIEVEISNESVAVYQEGKIKAVGSGTATCEVFVSWRGYEDMLTVDVNVIDDVILSFNQSNIVLFTAEELDGVEYLTSMTVAPVLYVNGAERTDCSFVFISSNEDIARVTNGTVTAVSFGVCEIEAKYISEENKEYTTLLTVTVKCPEKEADEVLYLDKSAENGILSLAGLVDPYDVSALYDEDYNLLSETKNENGFLLNGAPFAEGRDYHFRLVLNDKTALKVTVKAVTKILTTRQDLIDFRTLAAENAYGGYYVLGADIDMQNYEWQNWCGYYKTGGAVSGTNFSGTFDGRGYSISNLKIYMSAYTFSSNGFIGALGSAGVLKNVAFINYGLVCSEVGCYPVVLVGENAGLVENVYLEMDASTRITGSLTDAIHIFGTTGAGRYKNVFVNITGTPANGNEMVVTRATREYSFENVILIGQNLTNDANKSGTTATTYESVEAFSQANVDLSGFDDTVWDISGEYPVFRNYIWYIQIEGNYYDFDLSSAEDYAVPFTYGTAESVKLGGVSVAFTQNGTGITIGNADVKSAGCGGNTLAVSVGKEVYKFNVTIATKVITTRQDLIDFRTLAAGNAYGGYYVLGADIDMQNYEWQNWCGYYKTGGAVSGTSFSGTFDGRGYSILNLKIYTTYYTFSSNGFIGALGSTGVLKNVAFINYGLVCSQDGGTPILLVGENAGLVENVYLEMDASTRITGAKTDAVHIFGTTGAGRYKNVFVHITGTPANGNEMVVTRAAREYSFENVIVIGQNLTNDANKSGTTATTYENAEAFSQANVDLSGFAQFVQDLINESILTENKKMA